jgi:hypothetical protein
MTYWVLQLYVYPRIPNGGNLAGFTLRPICLLVKGLPVPIGERLFPQTALTGWAL